MSTGFFKRNERVVMTLLLILIAPTFAATGLVSWWAGNSAAVASYEINGETVSTDKFVETRRELSKSLWLQNVRRFGVFAARSDRFRLATVPDVLKQLVFEDEIVRLGIEPSDQSKTDAVREAVLDITTWYRVMELSGWTGIYQERAPDFNSMRPIARVDMATYTEALKSPNFGILMSKKEFEETIINSLRIQELVRSVVNAAVVTEKEIFDEYSTQNERRVLDLIQVPIEIYMEEARELVTPDDIEATYNENPERFVLQNRLSVEVARVDRAALQRLTSYEPSAEEVEARYEKDKDTLWRIRRPENYVAPEGATPEDNYRPLIDVFDAVVRAVTRDQAAVEEARLLQDALDQLNAMKDLGESVPMEQAFPEGLEYIQIRQISPFVQREVSLLDNEVKNPAAYATFFLQERALPGSVKPGDLYDSIAENSQGRFIIRVIEMLPERTMTFDEAIEDALKVAEETQAKKLLVEGIEVSLQRVRDEEVTLEEVAQDLNLTIHQMEPMSRSQSFNLKIDNRVIDARVEVIADAFMIEEKGEVVGPVISDTAVSGYVIRLKGIEPPDMELFDALRIGTESRLIRAKQQALLDAYELDRMAAADIKVYQDEGPAVPRADLIQNAEQDPEGTGSP
ncbi:MAG: hypothetical protein AAEJ46_01450 [Planctomycetota bacterium]